MEEVANADPAVPLEHPRQRRLLALRVPTKNSAGGLLAGMCLDR
jgi:hypothetical protein